MTVMTRDKVRDKVRKLVALSGSSNVHEAEVAAAAAQRLMLEYKISESEITVQTTEEDIVVDVEIYSDLHLKAPPRWHSILLNAVAQANFCSLILDSQIDRDGFGYSVTRVYQLIGTTEDRLTVKYLYEMLRRGVEHLCNEYARALPFDRADRASFKLGAAWSISDRLYREAQAVRAETRQAAHPNTIAVIDKTERALSRFMATRFPHVRAGRPVTVSRRGSFELGREVGRRVDVGRERRGLGPGQQGLPAGTA